jgi:putative addiction module component (TIGR02574 family)
MDLDLDQLSDTVLHLPAIERAELASRLLKSLDAPEIDDSPGSVAVAWEAELNRRDAEMLADPALGIPVADVFARLEEDLAARRRS